MTDVSRSAVLHTAALLAVIGLIDAGYLAYSAYTHTALVCNIDGLTGCNIVAQSSYSRIFGIPLATFGVVFYALILGNILYLRRNPSGIANRALLLFATLGMLSSVYFMYLQIFVIKTLCIYCVASFIISTAIWIGVCRLRMHSLHTMKHLLIALVLLVPQFAGAATISADKSLILSNPPAGNTYLAGAQVDTRAAVPGDLSVTAGTLTVGAPVAGDLLALGGTIIISTPIAGDVRALGGTIEASSPVDGDLFAFGGQVISASSARDVFLSGASIEARGNSTGPMQLYGADVVIDGTYSGDVTVIATDRFTLGPNARITGSLKYNAPQQLTIPPGAVVSGPITYTGSYQYIPTNDEAKTYALFGIGIFFIIRALGAVILAGLFAGIFPRFVGGIVADLAPLGIRRIGGRALLGLLVLVVSPFVAVLLLGSFAGANLALLLIALYVVVYIIAGAVGGVLTGACIRKHIFQRMGRSTDITWRDAAGGALVLYFLTALPYLGVYIGIIVLCISTGALIHALYRSARYST